MIKIHKDIVLPEYNVQYNILNNIRAKIAACWLAQLESSQINPNSWEGWNSVQKKKLVQKILTKLHFIINKLSTSRV